MSVDSIDADEKASGNFFTSLFITDNKRLIITLYFMKFGTQCDGLDEFLLKQYAYNFLPQCL